MLQPKQPNLSASRFNDLALWPQFREPIENSETRFNAAHLLGPASDTLFIIGRQSVKVPGRRVGREFSKPFQQSAGMRFVHHPRALFEQIAMIAERTQR